MAIGIQLVGDLEELLATRTLRRQSLFRMTGPNSQCWRAEAEIQQMYPGTRCLLLPSASLGLALLLEVLALEPGQEVLIAPFGWLSNWASIQRAGLVPRFLPLDDQLQLQPEQVAARIGDRTGAVIVTHLMGRGQQAVGRIAQLCADRGIPMLEDIAQSFGISVGGRRAGTFGIGAWCSLNRHKVLSTGDGGFVLVADPELFARVSARHDQGCVMVDGSRRPAEVLEPGLSLRVNEVTAAVLRAQLARFAFLRTRILALYDSLAAACENCLQLELIAPHEGDLPFTLLFRRSPHMRYPSLSESGWHIAPNVPWLEQAFARAARSDAAVAQTVRGLDAIAAVGSGFVDPYYAVPLGLSITDSPAEASRCVHTLQETL
jgi:dTDP-4-amino-4,6-dideoxygalactose transaminase